MGPIGIKPPRLRVALIAVLAALAAMAIAAPGIAQANVSLSLTCIPATVEAGEKTDCRAIVDSTTGPPPPGEIALLHTGLVRFLDLGDNECLPQPISENSVMCNFPVEGFVGGVEKMIGWFGGNGVILAETSTDLTIREGSLKLECPPSAAVVKDSIECVVRVPGTPGSPHATGTVEFDAISEMNAVHHPVEPSCELEPTPEGASCSASFTPKAVGRVAVLAEYEGDATHPADHGSAIVKVLASHEVKVVADCDHLAPVYSTEIKCTATVHNVAPSGGLPIGSLVFSSESSQAGGVVDDNCFVPVAIGPKALTCTAIFKTRKPGPQAVTFSFNGSSIWPSRKVLIPLDVKEGRPTSTGLTCQMVSVGNFGKCIVTVADSGANPVQPKGFVSFGVSPFGSPIQFDPETCTLMPLTPSTSRCEIAYKPGKAGGLILRSEYHGDPDALRSSKGETSVVVKEAVLGQ